MCGSRATLAGPVTSACQVQSCSHLASLSQTVIALIHTVCCSQCPVLARCTTTKLGCFQASLLHHIQGSSGLTCCAPATEAGRFTVQMKPLAGLPAAVVTDHRQLSVSLLLYTPTGVLSPTVPHGAVLVCQ